MTAPVRRARGFSLLEILVAFAIAAMALGVLYQAVGTSVRQVVDTAGYERATLLAESLLSAYASVPPQGISATGEAAGLSWQVSTSPHATAHDGNPRAARLHDVRISIQWPEGGRQRVLNLQTLRPQRKPVDEVQR